MTASRSRRVVFFCFLASIVLIPTFASASTVDFRVFIDLTEGQGCTVGGMSGVDHMIVTRVETTATAANVTRRYRVECPAGATSFGVPQDLDTTGWPAAFNPANGFLQAETKIPLSSLGLPHSVFANGSRQLTLGFDATNGSAVHSALKVNNSEIVFPPRANRRRGSVPGGGSHYIVPDTSVSDWGEIEPIVNGVARTGTDAIRIIKIFAYGNSPEHMLFFAFHAFVDSDAPWVVDDSYARAPGTDLAVDPAGVKQNDADDANNPSTAGQPQAQHGTVTLNADGSFTYVPKNANMPQSDSFAYKSSNGTKESNVAKVKIRVGEANNRPPDAVDDPISTEENTPVNKNVLDNDVDPDGDAIHVTEHTNPTNGTLSFNLSDGSFTYTPNENFVGSDSFTYTITDDSLTDTATVTITIENIDDLPVADGQDVVTNEGQPVAITLTGSDEEGATLTFNVTDPPNGTLTGTAPNLTYTPDPDYFGPDSFTFTVNDGANTSAPATVNITVNPVNDPPSFTSGGNVSSPEDAAYSAQWATNLSAGPANETGQPLTFLVTNDNNALFSVQPAISSTGVLTFTPALNAVGTVNVSATLSDNSGGTQTFGPVGFTITLTPLNDPPSFTSGGNVTVDEDSGAYSNGWAGSISAGPSDESAQTLTFNVSNNNNALFTAGAGQPAISPSGTLTFTPAPNANGSALVTVTLTDSAGATSTPPETFTITVTPVNDAPSFSAGPNQSVPEDSGAQSVNPWATAISDGPANESAQNVAFVIDSVSDTTLFTAGAGQPSVAPNGTLTYTPAPDKNGVATIVLRITDDGGTANGGVNTSGTQNFTITITAVNDPPTFTLTPSHSAGEDAAMQTIASFASSISVGPADEVGAGQTIASFNVSNDNNSLFTAGGQPAIATNGTLTYTPAPNASGSALVSVTATDSAGATSAPAQTFTITINAVNDAPVNSVPASPQTINEDTPLTFTGATAITVADVDAGSGALHVTLSAVNGTLSLGSVAGLATVTGNGTATVVFTGTLANINAALNNSVFTPAQDSVAAASVSITTNDQGNSGGGGPQSDGPDTVNITITPQNDAPSLTGGANTRSYTENAGATNLEPAITVVDPDAGQQMQSARVVISSNFETTTDVLTFTLAGTIAGTYDNTTGILALSGNDSVANYQSVLRSVGFMSTSQNPSTAARSISFYVTDADAVESVASTTTVNVTRVNDAPVNAVPASPQTINEDTPLTFTGGTAITTSDVDVPAGADVQVTLAATNGVLALNGGALAALTSHSGNGTAGVVITGTIAEVNAAMDGMTFTPTSNSTANGSVSITTNDLGSTGTPGAQSDGPDSVTINITPVNDNPVVDATSGSTTFTEANGPVVVDSLVAVSDIDSANLAGATVTITNALDGGLETLNATSLPGGITQGFAGGVLTLSGSASLADYQTALRSVTYNNASTSPDPTARVIRFQVNDGGAVNNLSATDDKNVTIISVNSPPVVTTSAGTTAFTENGAAVTVDGSVTVSDPDSTELLSATVKISNQLDGSAETLNAASLPGGITQSFVGDTLTLSHATGASLADFQTALQSVTYNNSDDTPSTTDRIINFQLNDGEPTDNLSLVATKTVSVAATNDAPTVTTTVAALSYTEDDPATAVDNGIVVADVDDTNLEGATVAITGNYQNGQDVLAFTNQNGISGIWDAPTGVLTLSGTSSVANYQTALRSVTYQNTSNNPNTTARTVTFIVNDGALPSNSGTRTINVSALNDAPTAVDDTGATNENTVLNVPATGVLTNDTDPDAGDTKSVTKLNGSATLTGTSTQGAAVTINANGSYSYDPSGAAALQALATGATLDDTFTYTMADAANAESTATVTITVTGVNDAPVVTTTVAALSYTENDPATAIDTGLTVTDVDDTNLEGATVAITGNYQNGQDVLAFSSQNGISGIWDAPTGTLTLSGTSSVANYQTALRSVTYQNTSENPSALQRTVTFTATDGENGSNSATRAINVSAVNDPPTAVNDTGATNENTTLNVPATGVLTNDTDPDAGDSKTVTKLNGSATLTGSSTQGAAVTINADGSYSYNPSGAAALQALATGATVDDTFTYTMADGAAAESTATVTITVTGVNDAPVVTTTVAALSYTENDPATAIDPGLTVTDIDDVNLEGATVAITGNYQNGQDVLAFSNQNGISGIWDAPTGTLTLSGTSSKANYQTALRSVTYVNTSEGPSSLQRTVSFSATDGENTSNVATRAINVANVNDPPTAVDDTGMTSEDAMLNVVAPGVLGNDTDPDPGDTKTVVAVNGLPANVGVAITTTGGATLTLNANGSYTYDPTGVAAYQALGTGGTANDSFTYTMQDTAAAQSTATVTITITGISDPPTLTVTGTLNFTEGQGATALNITATIVDPDDANMESATVTITTGFEATDVLGFTNQNGISGSFVGNQLSLTGSSSKANYVTALQSITYNSTSENPSTTARVITFIVNDGDAASGSQTSGVNVAAVNDPPVNNLPTNPQSVNEDTDLNLTGAGNVVSITDVDAQSGNIGVTITTTNGTSNIVTPTGVVFSGGTNNSALFTMTGTLANVNASLATLRFTPTLNFPNAAASGIASIELDTTDNGNTPAPAQTDLNDTFNITVNQVNDAPTAAADGWETLGNTEIRVDIGTSTNPHVLDTTANVPATPTYFGVLDNDSDPIEGNTISVTAVTGCTDPDTAFPLDCTLPSGAVLHMETNGQFTFTPAPGVASGSFTYTITDQPAAGTPMTANGTVTFTVHDMIWYVKQGASGNGTSNSPFGNFDSLDGVGGAGDSDDADDYLFVHAGAVSQATPVPLEINQHLLGEGVGLSINRNLNTNGAPVNLVAAGTKPVVTRTGGAGDLFTVGNAMPVEIRGLTMMNSGGNPIDVTTSGALTGSSTLTIGSNQFNGAGAEGIDFNMNAGTTGGVGLLITSNAWDVAGTHTGNAIDISRVAGGNLELTISNNTNIKSNGTGILVSGGVMANTFVKAFSNNTIHQTTGGNGVHMTQVTFDSTPADAAFQQVDGDNLFIGVDGDPVGIIGLSLMTVQGNLYFDDLDVFSTSNGLSIVSAGSGLTLAVNPNTSGGSSTFKATGGAALDINGATIDLRLAQIVSTNSAGNGVGLTNTSGTFSAPAGSSITNATGTDFLITGQNATVTYGGTIYDNTGQLISIDGSTGGTKTFSGDIDDLDGVTDPIGGGTAGNGGGISITANAAAVNFTGKISLSTGTTAAFVGTGGGTVSSTNTDSVIVTTTGTPLNIDTTDIGSAGMVWRSITSNGAANGIILNGTGNTGTFLIRGDNTLARNGSGGTINNTSSDAIRLTNAHNVTLQSMNVTLGGSNPATAADAAGTAGNHSVEASGGSGIVIHGMLIDGSRGTGFLGLNLTGTNRIKSNTRFDNTLAGAGHGIYINNVNTNLTLMDIDDIEMVDNNATHTNFFVANTGSANMTVTVTNSLFEDLGTQAVTMAGGGTAAATGTLTSTVSSCIFQNAKGLAENNLALLVNNGAVHNGTASGNTFSNVAEDGSIAGTSIIRTQNSAGVLNATVTGNTIQNIAYSVGGRHAIGHVFEPAAYSAGSSSTLNFSNNIISNITYTGTNREAIFVDYRAFSSSGEVTIQGNNINMPSAGSQQAIELRFRQTTASTVNVLVRGNTVAHNTSINMIDIDAEAAASVQATVDGNNNLSNSSGTPGASIGVATDDSGSPSMCVSITGNTLQGGAGTIALDEIFGTMNVVQAAPGGGAGTINTANGIPAGNVSVTGSPAFGQPACTLP